MVCNVSASLQHFYFDQHSRKQNFLNSFVDCSITDAKLFFEAPTQPGMMIDDTVRLVIVHAIVERNFQVINLAKICKISHGMDW